MIGLEKSGRLKNVKNLWDEKIHLESEVQLKAIANSKKVGSRPTQ